MNNLLKNWNNKALYSWSDGLQTKSGDDILDNLTNYSVAVIWKKLWLTWDLWAHDKKPLYRDHV